MKLIITLLLASMLVLKVQSAVAAIGGDCTTDTCGTNAECDTAPTPNTCACKATYTVVTAGADGIECKLSHQQPCTTDASCAGGTCEKTRKKCGMADSGDCSTAADCASGNCAINSNNIAKCVIFGGSSAIAASLILMVLALVTSRFL